MTPTFDPTTVAAQLEADRQVGLRALAERDLPAPESMALREFAPAPESFTLTSFDEPFPHILTNALRTNIAAAARGTDPAARALAAYWQWKIENWPERASIFNYYLTWIATGDEKWLGMALDERVMIPESYPNRDEIRQQCTQWPILYAVIKQHLTAEQDEEWQRRLRILGDTMAAYCRVGDWDECVSYLGGWMILDKVLGTEYMLMTRGYIGIPADDTERFCPSEVYSYVAGQFQSSWIKGGFVDAATSYAINTGAIHCLQIAALGKDAFPWAEEWLQQFRLYLIWALTHDAAYAESHGDTQEGPDGNLLHYYGPGLMWMVATLAGDEDGALRAASFKLRKYSPPQEPGNIYPYGQEWAALIADPIWIAQGDAAKPLPTGTHFVEGAGVVIDRQKDSTVFANYLNHFKDDHAYMGSIVNADWYIGKHAILSSPKGYGIGGNEVWNHNGFALKNNGWIWTRKCNGLERTSKGWVLFGETWGPSRRYYHDVNLDGSDDDFKDCHVWTEIEYTRPGILQFRHRWETPGDTFPHWTADLPVLRQWIHSRYPMRNSARGVEWDHPGHGKVVVTSNVRVAITQKKLHPSGEWWVAEFQSGVDEFNGEMIVSVLAAGSVVPEPKPPPPQPPEPDKPLLTYRAGEKTYRAYDNRLEIVETVPLEREAK